MIWVIVLTILLMSALYSAYNAAARARDTIERELEFNGQAMNIARAGITDALSWFRRQTTQPVTTFAPRLDLAAVPAVNETDAPAIGLVRSVEVSSGMQVWARYEVRIARQLDVTTQRGLVGAGTVWEIDSEGIIYKNLNPAVAFNLPPNVVVARVRLTTEIRRMVIVLPGGGAATCLGTPTGSNFNAKTKVIGGTRPGALYPNVGLPTITGTISGTPAQQSYPLYDAAIQTVFGVTDTELRSLSDSYTTNAASITDPLPADKLIYMDGAITFDVARPLNGTAVLVVNGNVTINASTNSDFSGLLYVQGNCTINAPSLVRGVVVTTGTLTLAGTGDYVEIDYDGSILSQLLKTLGQYRYSRPISLVE